MISYCILIVDSVSNNHLHKYIGKAVKRMNKQIEKNTNVKMSIREITLVGVMAAVTCILGPLSIPIGPVPITFTNLVIYISVILLGLNKGTLSYCIYLLIGLCGVPVFSGFTAGPAKLLGPTGGYLIGFIFMAVITGLFVEKFRGKLPLYIVGMILGSLINYLFGSLWLSYQAGISIPAAFATGTIPFIPGDLLKIVIALIIAPPIRKRLVQAGFVLHGPIDS